MEIKKVNLDRKPLDTEYIQSKQDFQQVLTSYKGSNVPLLKQPLFYGAIGLASLATVLTISVFNFEETKHEKVITSENVTKSPLIETIVKTPITSEAKIASLPHERNYETKKISNTVETQNLNSTQLEMNSIEETPVVEVKSVNNKVTAKKSAVYFPHIDGQFDGDITLNQLCGQNGIQTDDGKKITSFKFQYSTADADKIIVVKGNRIPETICGDLTKSRVEQMVFITDIEAIGEGGSLHLPSMNFWLTFKSL